MCHISWTRAKHLTAPGPAVPGATSLLLQHHTNVIQKRVLKGWWAQAPWSCTLQAQSRLLADGGDFWWVLYWVPSFLSACASCLQDKCWSSLWKEVKDKAGTMVLLEERSSFLMSVVHIICLLLGFVCCWCCLSTHTISLSNILPCSLVKTDAICNSYSVQLDINILWGSLLGHVYVAMYNLYIYIKQSHVLYIQINERMDKNNKIKKKSGSNKTGKLIHFDPNCFCYSGSFCGLSACFTH